MSMSPPTSLLYRRFDGRIGGSVRPTVAMEAQSRDIYRAYMVENRPVEEVAATFGVSADIIYKVKNRVNKMIEAVEEEYAEG